MAAMPLATSFADELTEQDFFDDLPVVMSATRLPQTVMDAPASVTVLDREAIEASGFISIGDLFRLVPGFQVGLGWRDHHTAVTYHGQTDGLSRRMQVLIDGRVAFTSMFGLADWDRLGITVLDIERIEVTRGPVGSAFGSNAFIAAINIVTRDASSTEGMSLTTVVGSEDTSSVSGRYSSVSGDSEYTLALNYLDSDGFDGANNDIQVTSLRLDGRNQINPDWTIDYQLSHAQGPTGRGGTIPLIDPVGHKEVREDYGLIRVTNTSDMNSQWHLQLTYNRTRESDKNYVGTIDEFLSSNIVTSVYGSLSASELFSGYPVNPDERLYVGAFDFHSDRVIFDTQQTIMLSGGHRVVWGAGIQESRAKSKWTLDGPGYKTDFMGNAYSNWELRIGDFLYNAGVMFEDGDLADGNISSRFGVNYSINKTQVIRISFAQGWRTPFVGEAYQNLGVKTEAGFSVERVVEVPETLDPEKITSIEIGFIGHSLNGSLRTEIKIFHEKISHELQEVIDPFAPELISIYSPGVFYRINGGQTEIDGVDLGIDYRFDSGLRATLSYSYADMKQKLPIFSLRMLNQNPGTPKHSGSLLLSKNFNDGWSASAGFYHMGDMGWYVYGDDIDSYNRIDARIAKQFMLGSSNAKIELIGQNLGDSYQEFSLRNEFDSQVFVRFTLDFK